MTPDQFFTPKIGQSLLIPGQAEKFRGQCVQPVGLWTQQLGIKLPEYLYAYLYYQNGIPGYTKIPRNTDTPRTGDIVVWGANFPDSPGAGHIDVVSQDGSWNDFYGWDSNWSPPLKLNRIHHTVGNQYIVGLLRKEGGNMPGTADSYTVQALAEALLARTAAGDQNLMNNVGRPVNDVIDTFRTYKEATDRMIKANNYDKDVKAAYEKGLAEGGGGQYVETKVYVKKG